MASLSVIESTSAIGCCSEVASSSSNEDVQVFDETMGNNNTQYHTQMDMKSPFPKRESVNISFRNLKYTVNNFNFSKRQFEKKELLKGINGEFAGGKLTAIMGPSGAGKSTLLNCLAGYVESGISGSIKVNGKLRSVNTFRKSSAYIHQDDALRPWLVTHEAMMVAAHLKLGFNVSHEHKTKLVKQILTLLGLDQHIMTLTCKLSGGQKKRLAIALELISNPPVLFLDEPTTGLDSASCGQCVSLMKRLAQEGRTVICTIHQPSALLFEMFDNLYCMSQGFCIYQGVVQELVPFLAENGHNCPSYHNPADFMIEVASGEYDADMNKLAKAATRKYDKTNLHRIRDVTNYKGSDIELSDMRTKKHEFERDFGDLNNEDTIKNHRANMLMQFLLLFQRNFICMKRNYKILLSRLIAHAVIGSIFGYLYLNVGTLATTVIGNYVYLYGSMLLVVYTGKMSVMMSFPIEMEMMKREHFNRWYNLVPYFLSVVTFEIPFQVICAATYLSISFWLTGNYNDNWRFHYFMLLSILSTLAAQSWGFFTGSALPIKLAVFIGPVFAVLLSVFGFCNRYVDITKVFSWMWHVSYFRVGFHGILNTVYGMGKGELICPDSEMYCHFKTPKVFLEDMMIADISMLGSVMMLGSVFVVMHFATLFTLWFKLNRR